MLWKFKRKLTSALKKNSKRRHKKSYPVFDQLYVLGLKTKLYLWDIPKPSVKIIFLVSFVFFLYSTTTLLDLVFEKLPTPQDLANRQIPVSTKIYDRNGVLLYQVYKDENRTPIKLNEVPQTAVLATLAIEDAQFYSHPGFSIKGIFRSLIKNTSTGSLTGGSTITQQLIKNALLTPDKTYLRKLREVVLAIKIERAYSKDQILEMYLNEVAYGNSAYGIEEASKIYFDKSAKDLNLAEAALLAGLPKGPSRFSPFGQNLDLAINRQHEVLDLMVTNNFISRQLADNAKSQELKFAAHATPIHAPHFVMYVKELLANQFGLETLETGGLEVHTTLDIGIQKMAEEAVSQEISKLSKLKVGNGAAIVLNPQTGEILAMVGSKNYFDSKNDGQVNVVLSLRSPGSSIKIVTYTYALSHGMTPATSLQDSPLTINIQGQKPYTPKNYDSGFRGMLTLRSALAESRNIPAVRIINSYGVENIRAWGEALGITTWQDKNRFGPSLTLGGGEVKLIDLARVYATVANQGKRPDLIAITKISDYKNNILLENGCVFSNSCAGNQVIDPRVAYQLIDILKDNFARTPAFGGNSALVIPGHPEVAVKTGTSNDLRDNLTVGFNQNYLVAVWVGNNDNSPMGRIASGITGAAPIWNKIMGRLLANVPSTPWSAPSKLVQKSYCGKTSEWFLEENQTSPNCNPSPSPSPTPTPSPRPKGRR